MSTRIEVTEDQIQAGFKALLGSERDRVSLSMVRAILTGALNPPLVLCKNCGKIEAQHHRLNMPHANVGTNGAFGWTSISACPGAVWEASE